MIQTGTILVVEDEPAIAESVAYALRREGFASSIASDLRTAWEQSHSALLIVLDLMLPDGSGSELIHGLRKQGNRTPIIVLSSRDSETDRIGSLEAGADDYVTKPFSPREVVARVRAVLRRFELGTERSPRFSWIGIDAQARRAFARDVELELTRVEFDLLAQLNSDPGRVFARSELIDLVWGNGFAITDRTIDSHVKSLRRKLASAGAPSRLIETVRGIGYRLSLREPQPEDAAL